MQEIVAHDRCTGCSACMNRCPKSCISMEAGDGGFLYPVIDTATCIDCGQCQAVCPALHHDAYSGNNLPRAYAAHQNSKNALEQCSSGGVFELYHRLKSGQIICLNFKNTRVPLSLRFFSEKKPPIGRVIISRSILKMGQSTTVSEWIPPI